MIIIIKKKKKKKLIKVDFLFNTADIRIDQNNKLFDQSILYGFLFQ